MASNGKVIKNKIQSVKNIRKITRTMEMVSVVKMRKAVEKTVMSRAFTHEAYEMLSTISKRSEVQNVGLFLKPDAERELVCIVASNKGMCGAYNINVAKEVRTYMAKTATPVDIITVGKQAEKIAGRYTHPVIASFTHFSEELQTEESLALSRVLIKEFLTGTYRAVRIISTDFINSTQYETKNTKLLPLSMQLSREYAERAELEVGERPYLIEPNVETLVEHIVPKLVNAIIYQILLDALASEHSARMIAMKNATDSAGELIHGLTLTFNQIRQASITQELSEIIAGASALQS